MLPGLRCADLSVGFFFLLTLPSPIYCAAMSLTALLPCWDVFLQEPARLPGAGLPAEQEQPGASSALRSWAWLDGEWAPLGVLVVQPQAGSTRCANALGGTHGSQQVFSSVSLKSQSWK